MELSVLNDGKVLFIELKGKIKLYDPNSGITKVVGELDVFANHEDGLLGLATDPDFDANHFIYLYYAPAGEESINRLSRFSFKSEQLDIASEKVLLDIPVKRACCHSGGSLAFGPDGNLFLSLGDDTNPFESASYNPIDERPGRSEPWDAQRSSANSKDLRGKILRIHPEPDGSYTIPEGNLFPKGMPDTRPEIYVMGNRNPFRIAVDQKSGYLYWGEVGPDAGVDSVGRGPKGYDEINQARQGGFFGWPYFIADNKPYWDYDFVQGKASGQFDAKAPVNDSPNNKGIKSLPPAQKAFIWYPYSESAEFPLVGKGGRNAMAGPVFYYDMYAPSEVKFPEYYHGKLFIYDWMRDWVMAVTLDRNSDFQRVEEFMPNTIFSHPIDMQFGKDGALYVLEYGTYWHSQNDDARLSRIEFSEGNRKPIVKVSVDKKAGAVPATFAFSSQGSFDYDQGDALTYEWTFDTPGTVQSTEANPAFTFHKPGIYRPILKVTDAAGKAATAELEVRVGNEPPQVMIEVKGNRSFYWDNIRQLNYTIKVSDKEDGSLEEGTILPSQIKATFSYLGQGNDMIQAAQGHQMAGNSGKLKGKILMDGSDCKACHAIDKASVGPSYSQIAARYENDADAVEKLSLKIINGGGGSWGDREMAAHPQISKNEAKEIVRYILSLAEPDTQIPVMNMPPAGKLNLSQPTGKAERGVYTLLVSYQDKGGNGVGPLTGRNQLVLRYPEVLAADGDEFRGAAKAHSGDSRQVKFTEDKSYVLFKDIDLTDIKKVSFAVDPANTSGRIELRLSSPEGTLIGSTKELSKEDRPDKRNSDKWFDAMALLEPTNGVHDIYIVFHSQDGVGIWNGFYLNTLYFYNESR